MRCPCALYHNISIPISFNSPIREHLRDPRKHRPICCILRRGIKLLAPSTEAQDRYDLDATPLLLRVELAGPPALFDLSHQSDATSPEEDTKAAPQVE